MTIRVDIALFVLRVVIGAIVAMHGFLKLGWVGKGGGPIGPGLIAADLLVITYVAHWPQGSGPAAVRLAGEFPLSLAAAGFALAILGPGGWSLDRLLGLAYPDWLLGGWLVVMAIGALAAIGSRLLHAPPPRPC